ncbi:MAG: hypothetical protein R3A51_18550, partial [Nannocystaceae bacterium]
MGQGSCGSDGGVGEPSPAEERSIGERESVAAGVASPAEELATLRREVNQWRGLITMMQRLNEVVEDDELLATFAAYAHDLLPADRVSVALVDD